MSTKVYGLQDIKKELKHLPAAQTADLLLRLARYKKENKELLAYLLFEAHDEHAFIEQVKAECGFMFSQLPSHSYQMAKSLRKILRLISKYVKFIGSNEAEITLLLNFGNNYLQYADRRGSYKPLRLIFTRQLEKTNKAIQKLHEDVQADYSSEYEQLLADAELQLKWFDKRPYML